MAYPSPVGVASKAFTGGTITIGFADLPAGTAIGDSNRALTTDEMNYVGTYLANKYGVTWTGL